MTLPSENYDEKYYHHLQAALARPKPWLLANLLMSRLASEEQGPEPVPLSMGGDRQLRPLLPKIGRRALMLYVCRRAVDSYPLIFTTLALAHPN